MLRTYKYLLRPTSQQSQSLDFLLWQSRLVYNAALEQRITTYKEMGKGMGYAAQWRFFRDVRRANPETTGKLNASSLQHLLRRLDKAFLAFFRRVKAGEIPGFPRFKGRSRFKSIEFTYGDGCKLRPGQNGRMNFYIQNVGEMRLCYHRAIPKDALLKHVIVKQVNKRWYICIMLEIESARVQHIPTGKAVGIDLGLKSLVAVSSGEHAENPRWLRTSLAKLRRLQRHASRQVRGSNRQQKSYARIARLSERTVNQRADYLHKVSRRLVSEYDLIAMEDLPLDFMNRNPHLALSSRDAGFGMLRQMIEYKAAEAGIQIIAVNPSYTTQRCSQCGCLVLKDLSVRVHDCPYCGLLLDRDINAARNILQIALQNPLGRSGQDQTWAVAPSVF